MKVEIIFHFENLVLDMLQSILKDSFLDVDNSLGKYADTIVKECKKQNINPSYIAVKIIQEQGKDGKGSSDSDDDDDETDPLLNEAIETVIESGTASTSFIQRRFKVGYEAQKQDVTDIRNGFRK